MSVKVVKSTRMVGHANEQGLSFPADQFMYETKKAFDRLNRKIKSIGGVSTGPAKVIILVEQEVLIDD